MAQTTDSTLIAAYRSSADAQAAAADLQAAGINRSDIFLESGAGATASTEATDSYGSRTARHEGGIAGWFKSLFDGEDANTAPTGYHKAIEGGGYLLSVDVHAGQVDSVETILNRHNPLNVSTDDQTTYGNTGTAAVPPVATGTSTRPVAATGAVRDTTNEAIPVIQEEMQVGKRQVLRGGVRVFSRMVETPVEESIGLREEHVNVQRNPVNRAATDADFAAGREQTIEVDEYAEEAVVGKQVRVVEEVSIGKTSSERTETVKDTLRHTEVNVEQVPGSTATSSTTKGTTGLYDEDFRRDFQTRYASTGASYDTYSPAYTYGSEMAADPRYKGRNFSDVESDLRSDYGRRYPNSTWEKMKDSVRTGWDRVTGR